MGNAFDAFKCHPLRCMTIAFDQWDVTFHQQLVDWSRYMGGNTVAFDMSVGKPVPPWVHLVNCSSLRSGKSPSEKVR